MGGQRLFSGEDTAAELALDRGGRCGALKHERGQGFGPGSAPSVLVLAPAELWVAEVGTSDVLDSPGRGEFGRSAAGRRTGHFQATATPVRVHLTPARLPVVPTAPVQRLVPRRTLIFIVLVRVVAFVMVYFDPFRRTNRHPDTCTAPHHA